MKTPPRKKQQRVDFLSRPKRPCPNCGKAGSHFVGPSMGDAGFFICDPQSLVDKKFIQPYQKPLLEAMLKHLTP